MNQSVDLWGTATDFLGKEIPLTWTSNIDGELGDDSMTVVPSASSSTTLKKCCDDLSATRLSAKRLVSFGASVPL